LSRPRKDGIVIGTLEPGPRNSIADVGVTVGHVTVERTGVTAVVPPSLPLPAGSAVLNGAGELTGSPGAPRGGGLRDARLPHGDARGRPRLRRRRLGRDGSGSERRRRRCRDPGGRRVRRQLAL